jgi:hypothetical protein
MATCFDCNLGLAKPGPSHKPLKVGPVPGDSSQTRCIKKTRSSRPNSPTGRSAATKIPLVRGGFTSDENRTRTSTSSVDVLASWGAHDRLTTGDLGDRRKGCKQALCCWGSGLGNGKLHVRGKDPQGRGREQTLWKETGDGLGTA